MHRVNIALGIISGAILSAIWAAAEFGAESVALAECLWIFIFLPLFGFAGAILATRGLRMLACGTSIATVILLANHRWA